jgi:hypothetical protein
MMTLCYAWENGHTVLAGDRPLRERCVEEGVAVRGSIWIVEEAHRQRLLEAAELMRWLSIWPTVGRRLPAEELKRLRQLLSTDNDVLFKPARRLTKTQDYINRKEMIGIN